jgi:predicted DCC family thiol-disulfide oxidoreductase YuxK
MNPNDHIVLFDGVCNLCNRSVQFVIKHDKHKLYKFASLQSEAGRQLLIKGGLDPNSINSIILIYKGKYYNRSTAALKLLTSLNWHWKFFNVFLLIPTSFRDYIYNTIAKNRYRWFGKRKECYLPNLSIIDRFLS